MSRACTQFNQTEDPLGDKAGWGMDKPNASPITCSVALYQKLTSSTRGGLGAAEDFFRLFFFDFALSKTNTHGLSFPCIFPISRRGEAPPGRRIVAFSRISANAIIIAGILLSQVAIPITPPPWWRSSKSTHH